MNNKAAVPLIVVAAIALIGFLVWWGKKNFSGPEAYSTKETGVPPFIDPETNRPWAPGKGPNAGGPGGPGSATTNEAPKAGGGGAAGMRNGR